MLGFRVSGEGEGEARRTARLDFSTSPALSSVPSPFPKPISSLRAFPGPAALRLDPAPGSEGLRFRFGPDVNESGTLRGVGSSGLGNRRVLLRDEEREVGGGAGVKRAT